MISLLDRAADAVRRHILKDDHGRMGEGLAHGYLRRKGCTVVARRYRSPSGGGENRSSRRARRDLVFVEVKTRATREFGPPDRARDAEKEEYLAHAGGDFARPAGVEWKRVRFYVLGIILTRPPQIEWLRDAFRPGERGTRRH